MNFAIRWGSSIALASLAFVVVYWGALGFLHTRAVAQAHATADSLARRNGESVLRVAAMPSLADPMRWRVLAETNRATYRFDTSLSVSGQVDAEILAGLARYEKPQGEALAQVARAAQDERAVIFLDFARFSAVRVEPQSCAAEFLVRFADLRFTEPGNTRRGGNFALDVPVSGLP